MEPMIRHRKTPAEDRGRENETLLPPASNVKIVDQKNGRKHSIDGQQETHTIPVKVKAMRTTLYILHKALNIVYVPLFIYRLFEKSTKCTGVSDEILLIPANDLARKIRRKEISCETVIRTYISRIKEVNPLLNAVIDDRFTDAVEEARKVDRLVSSEGFLNDEESIAKKYPLLGVPITVKGSIAVKGLKFTSGMVTRKEIIAEADAVTVELARKAGAIPLVVSNVPELCMNWETTNKLIGTTVNPYDSTRSCGGSSGGEASLIGSGASLIGIGSDIAGSLRLPAHYCGVYGHKPTPGVVSYEGHYPSCLNREKWESVFTLGPMARYAGDLRILLGVISNQDKQVQLGLNEKVDVGNIKVYFNGMEGHFWTSTSQACALSVNKVAEHFKTISATPPQKVDIELLQFACDFASLILLDIDNVDHIFDNNGDGFYSELFRYLTFRSKHTFPVIAYGMLRKLNSRIPESRKENVRTSLEKLKGEFERILGKDGVFILPTFPVEAIKHGDWLRLIFGSGYMSIFNVLGFPVTNCPVGVTKDGLPLGVQVVGLPYSDKLTLSVAEELEKAFGGWRAAVC